MGMTFFESQNRPFWMTLGDTPCPGRGILHPFGLSKSTSTDIMIYEEMSVCIRYPQNCAGIFKMTEVTDLLICQSQHNNHTLSTC